MALRGFLLPEKQGMRDLYWCWVYRDPVLVYQDNKCSVCGCVDVTAAKEVHEFLGSVDRPERHGPNDDTVGTSAPSRGVDQVE
jgi:hypothetical protein